MTESKEFAMELFDAISRRRQMQVNRTSKEELYEIWQEITDSSFDSRLQIFFDMYVTILFAYTHSLAKIFFSLPVCQNQFAKLM